MQSGRELYNERAKRLTDAIALKVPDRVPICILFGYFPAKYAGITCQDSFYDFPKWKQAYRKAVEDFAPDLWRLTTNQSGQVLETLDHTQLKWPGHGVSPNASHQYVEGEYMKVDEYDQFLKDPSDFITRAYLPRAYGALSPLTRLPSLNSPLFGGVPAGELATPEMVKMFETLAQTAKQAFEWRTEVGAFITEMTDLGFPSPGETRMVTPFDLVSDNLRGMRGSMLDMYRKPDKLLALCEKILEMEIEKITAAPKAEGFSTIFIPLHRGSNSFMSPEQFEIFYWPHLKALTLAIINSGATPYLFFEGDYNSRLEYLLDLPKGKILAHFDNCDINKVKEILGNHTCIMGNVPLTLLQTATPQEVKDHCKQLIDVAGKGGGFILAPRGAIDDVKAENLRAMVDFTREYGVYE